MSPPRVTGAAGRALAIVATAALLSTIYVVKPRGDTVAWTALFDAGHAPLFGAVALLVLAVVLGVREWPGPRRLHAYLVALAISVAIGAIVEGAQFWGPRNADPWDMLRNILGSISFLLMAASFDRVLTPRLAPSHVPVAGILRIAAVSVFAVALVPLGIVGLAYAQRRAEFPRLLDFQGYWETHFLEMHYASLTLAYTPEEWPDRPDGALAGEVMFSAVGWPSLEITEVEPDWTAYDRLVFEAFVPDDAPFAIRVRVDDDNSDDTFGSRFSEGYELAPGANLVTVPFDDIRAGPADRELDLRHVRRLFVIGRQPERPRTVYLDAFRLERIE